ncbi:MAG: hypothetical protein V1936_04130 [Patescibacteria group bacterium]
MTEPRRPALAEIQNQRIFLRKIREASVGGHKVMYVGTVSCDDAGLASVVELQIDGTSKHVEISKSIDIGGRLFRLSNAGCLGIALEELHGLRLRVAIEQVF